MSDSSNNFYSPKAMAFLRYAVIVLSLLILLSLFAVLYKLVIGDDPSKDSVSENISNNVSISNNISENISKNNSSPFNFTQVIKKSSSLGLYFTSKNVYMLSNPSSSGHIEILVYDLAKKSLSGRFDLYCGSEDKTSFTKDSQQSSSPIIFFDCR